VLTGWDCNRPNFARATPTVLAGSPERQRQISWRAGGGERGHIGFCSLGGGRSAKRRVPGFA